MSPPPAPHRIRARWVVAGVVIWLILASSVTLELGQQATAQWGSLTALGVMALALLALPLRGATRTGRAGVRLLRHHIRNRR